MQFDAGTFKFTAYFCKVLFVNSHIASYEKEYISADHCSLCPA